MELAQDAMTRMRRPLMLRSSAAVAKAQPGNGLGQIQRGGFAIECEFEFRLSNRQVQVSVFGFGVGDRMRGRFAWAQRPPGLKPQLRSGIHEKASYTVEHSHHGA